MFFLLYKRADDAVFDDFPRMSDHFPKISEVFQNCSEGQPNLPAHFPNILRRLPKIAEDDRRRSEDVSIIHQQILVQLKGQQRNVIKHDLDCPIFSKLDSLNYPN